MYIFPDSNITGVGGANVNPLELKKNNEENGKTESSSTSTSIFTKYDDNKNGVIEGAFDTTAASYVSDKTRGIAKKAKNAGVDSQGIINSFIKNMSFNFASQKVSGGGDNEGAKSRLDAKCEQQLSAQVQNLSSFIQSEYSKAKAGSSSEGAQSSLYPQGSYMNDVGTSGGSSGSTLSDLLTAGLTIGGTVAALAASESGSKSNGASKAGGGGGAGGAGGAGRASSSSSAADTPSSQSRELGDNMSGIANAGSVQMPSSNLASLASKVHNVTPDTYMQVQSELNDKASEVDNALTNANVQQSSLGEQKQTAEGNVKTLQDSISTVGQERDASETSLNESKDVLDQSINTRDEKDEELRGISQEYDQACSDVQEKESNKSTKQTELTNAQSQRAQAEANVESAEANVSAAQSTLDSIDPEKNPDAYAAAEAALEAAEQALTEAQQALEDAKVKEQEAEEALNTAEEELQTAQENKSKTLDELEKTNGELKELIDQCRQNQETVETNQNTYDNNLADYSKVNANYEKLNTELNNQQGILTKYDEVSGQIADLTKQQQEIADLKTQLESKYNDEVAKIQGVADDIFKNANSSEGASAAKTPLENLLSLQGYDTSKCTGDMWINDSRHSFSGSWTRDELRGKGYVENKDGSFTDPRTGVTCIESVDKGGNSWWQPTSAYGNGRIFSYEGASAKNPRSRDVTDLYAINNPEIYGAAQRSAQQLGYEVTGINKDGTVNLRRKASQWR